MSSQWVDANGDQWRFSNVTSTWQKLVNGVWTVTPLPSGGLQRVVPGQVASTVTAPPWPVDENPILDAPEWVDAQGDPWRYDGSTGSWQKLVDNEWVASSPPAGGLRKITDPAESPLPVVVVETMGPRGPQGEQGPPGVSYLATISEVIPAQLQDGVTTTFGLSSSADLTQSVQVFRNGLMEVAGQGYFVTETEVTFTTPPLNSDVLTVVYQKAE